MIRGAGASPHRHASGRTSTSKAAPLLVAVNEATRLNPRAVTVLRARLLKAATVTLNASGAKRARPKASPVVMAVLPSPLPVSSGRRPPPVSRAVSL